MARFLRRPKASAEPQATPAKAPRPASIVDLLREFRAAGERTDRSAYREALIEIAGGSADDPALLRRVGELAEKLGLTVERIERDVAAARELAWVCSKIARYPALSELQTAAQSAAAAVDHARAEVVRLDEVRREARGRVHALSGFIGLRANLEARLGVTPDAEPGAPTARRAVEASAALAGGVL